MNIKAKISAGLIALVVIILLIGGFATYYLNALSNDARAILKDNYISLQYISDMQRAMNDRTTDPSALRVFEQHLRLQEKNVTEMGEREATSAVRRDFERLKKGQTDSLTVQRLLQNLLQIDDLNRQAMFRKNQVAEQTANDALLVLASLGTFCFLFVFSFLINFPGYIANPIRELTRSIQQIAARNYEERVHFRSDDEFGELARAFNTMAQKLDEYEHSNLARILFEKKRIDTLIQLMTDGIIGLDENKYVLFANPVACRLLGVEEEQLTGRYAPDLASVNDLMRTLIQDLMGAAIPEGGNLLKIYDSGKESYFNRKLHRVSVTRTGEAEPIEAGYVIVLENITPYKELDLAKTNFIATVSHELKTPIAAIKMSLKLLEDHRVGNLNEEQQKLLMYLRSDSDRLLNLTGELLNMAQVESGQIQLRIGQIAPAEIVSVATAGLDVSARQKNIRFNVDLAAGLPLVEADPDKASWVLINFLSNAVRHSPSDNSVDIHVRLVGRQVEFEVRDYGGGIRPEHQDRVFDRYFRAPGNQGQTSGTGLGLAISKEFIAAMGGEVGLRTEVTDGAAFYFRLPAGG